MQKLNDVSTLENLDGIGVITIDSPPVNALSVPVRRGLAAGMASASADQAIQAIVIRCSGKTFFAGFDISEFDGGL